MTFNHHACFKIPESLAKFRWRLSNLITLIRLNLFVKINFLKWLDLPFVHSYEQKRGNTRSFILKYEFSTVINL